jgi:hypothetical protein
VAERRLRRVAPAAAFQPLHVPRLLLRPAEAPPTQAGSGGPGGGAWAEIAAVASARAPVAEDERAILARGRWSREQERSADAADAAAASEAAAARAAAATAEAALQRLLCGDWAGEEGSGGSGGELSAATAADAVPPASSSSAAAATSNYKGDGDSGDGEDEGEGEEVTCLGFAEPYPLLVSADAGGWISFWAVGAYAAPPARSISAMVEQDGRRASAGAVAIGPGAYERALRIRNALRLVRSRMRVG